MEGLRALDERADPLGTLLGSETSGQPGQVGLGGGVDPLAGRQQEGTVEAAVAHLAGEVVHGRLAPLGLGDHPVEQLAQLGAVGAVVPLQPAFQQGEHGRDLARHAPLGDGDAEQALLQLRRAVEAADAVVGEGAAELIDEAGGQALAAGVEVAQVGEEVLLGAVAAIAATAVRRMAAEERADVGEGAEDLLFQAELPFAAAGGSRDEALDGAGIGVVTEDQPAGLLEALAARSESDRLVGRYQGIEAHLVAVVHGGGAVFTGHGLEHEERTAGADLGVPAHQHLAHAARRQRQQRGLHLHGFEHRQRIAGRHLVPLLDGERDHHGRRRRAHHDALVALDTVGDAVDLDEQPAALEGQGGPPAPVAAEDPAAGAPRGPGEHVEMVPAGLHPEEPLAEARDAEEVGPAPVAQLDRVADVLRHLGPAAGRRGVEAGAGGVELGLVLGDGRHQEGRFGAPPRQVLAARHQRGRSSPGRAPLVSSGRSSTSARKALSVAPPRMEASVRARPRCRRASASARVRPWAVTRAISSPFCRRVALLDGGIGAQARPGGEAQGLDDPGLGVKPSSGSRAERQTCREQPRGSGGWASSVPPRDRWASRAARSVSSRASTTAAPAGRPAAVPRKRCSPLAASARNETVKAPAAPRAPANRAAASRSERASSGEIPGGGDSTSTGRSR